jgi:hypothetical protein
MAAISLAIAIAGMAAPTWIRMLRMSLLPISIYHVI